MPIAKAVTRRRPCLGAYDVGTGTRQMVVTRVALFLDFRTLFLGFSVAGIIDNSQNTILIDSHAEEWKVYSKAAVCLYLIDRNASPETVVDVATN